MGKSIPNQIEHPFNLASTRFVVKRKLFFERIAITQFGIIKLCFQRL